jgi:hypothetical protein
LADFFAASFWAPGSATAIATGCARAANWPGKASVEIERAGVVMIGDIVRDPAVRDPRGPELETSS